MICKKCKQIIPNGSKYCMYCGKNQLEEPARKKHYRPHGHGSISYYKNCPKNPYRATVKVNGKTKSLGYFPTSKDADRAITEYMAAYDESVSPRIDWTLEHFYNEWSEKTFPNLSKGGKYSHISSWKHLQKLHKKKMKDLKTGDYQDIIDDVLDSGGGVPTCQKIRNLISRLCEEAMKNDVIDKNYASLLEIPTYVSREKDIFSDEEIERLKEHDEDDMAKYILILIYTGLRVGELLALTPQSINLDEWYFIGGSKTKAGKNRTVPILPQIQKYFVYFVEKCPSEESSIYPYQSDAFRRGFYDYLVKLNILTNEETQKGKLPRLTPHCTRHTFASLARKANVEKDVLIRVMGHSDYKITDDVYVSMDRNMLTDELQKIAK